MKRLLAPLTFLVVASCGADPVPIVAPPAPSATAPSPAPSAAPAAVIAPSQQFESGCNAELAEARRFLDQVRGVPSARTVDNTLEPLNEALRRIANVTNRGSLWKEVHPDPKVRDAARACSQEAQRLTSATALDRGVYDALRGLDVKGVDGETQRFVALALRDAKLAGVELDDAKRKRIAEIDEEMTKLSQEFEKNIAEDTRSVDVDPKRLAGLPADYVAAHPPREGLVKITTDWPDYSPVMYFATDDDLRKQIYVKFLSRADAHNEEVLRKLLARRAEKARLLGFGDWADYVSADKMLKGGKAEADFIERVAKLATKRAASDHAELLAELRKTDPKAKSVASWQKYYLERQIKKAKYEVDSGEVRKYFTFDRVLEGLLDITSRLYDVGYEPVKGDPVAWHADVRVYDVARRGEKLGRIYLDMHPRADKYKHMAEFGIRDGVTGKQLPEGALVCNFADPKASGGPAFVDHEDVVTLFHEFGHLMHQILGGKHRWVRLSGISTEQDFTEAPSQMFEEWAWSHETLRRFAKSPDGQTIPEELVAKMRRADKFALGTQTRQQMFLAAVSLHFHQADPASLDQVGMVKELQAKYTPFAYVEGTKFHAGFGHLTGYSSMYYTYMWSLVLAKDMLTMFAKPGLMSVDVARRYRDTVLAPGGAKDAAELVKDFLGRPYDFKAFEAYLRD